MTKMDKDRADRLAAALRENLRKRKAQAREAADERAARPLHHHADGPPAAGSDRLGDGPLPGAPAGED